MFLHLVLVLLGGFIPQIFTANLHHGNLNSIEDVSSLDHAPWIPALVCSLSIVCVVIVVIGCLDFCRRDQGFKDFDNEDAFSTETVGHYHSSDFTMYPPVENTPEAAGGQMPIYFEPLPDVASQHRQEQRHLANTLQLRPKVAMTGRERSESDDDLEEIIHKDSIQEKKQLQALLTNRHSQLPRSQLQYIKELGSGWFGKVLQGEGQQILPGHKKTKIVVQILKEDADHHDQLAFLLEATPYRDVDHQNVLRMLGQCVESTPFLSVLELCPFGDLKTYLRSHRVAQESFNDKGLVLKFACEMAAGLQALHQLHFVHRDFAIRNCLLASDLTVKVGDYGLSEETFKEDYYTDRNGDNIPIRWLAPDTVLCGEEGILLRSITKQANIWSYGVAVWEVITFGALPYADLTNDHVVRLVLSERSVQPNKPDVQLSHIDRVYELMRLCWSEPAQRPSLRELRIMLLHLLSRKDEPDTAAFDQKWNMLLPRKAPVVSRSKLPTVTVNNVSIDPGKTPVRPTGFESDFADLNGSLVANAGSFEIEEQPASFSSQGDQKPANQDVTSPINELSLEAELGQVKLDVSSEDRTPDNELSVGEELMRQEGDGSSADEDQSDEGKLQRPESPQPQSDLLITKGDEQTTEADLEKTPFSMLNKRDGPLAQSTPVKEDLPGLSLADPPPDSSDLSHVTQSTNEDEAYLTANQSQLGSEQVTEASGLYVTTQESPAARSVSRSLSSEYSDRSLLGQQKFAAMLQTVAISYDGQEPLSGSFGSMNKWSGDDVFEESETKEDEEKTLTEDIEARAPQVSLEPDSVETVDAGSSEGQSTGEVCVETGTIKESTDVFQRGSEEGSTHILQPTPGEIVDTGTIGGSTDSLQLGSGEVVDTGNIVGSTDILQLEPENIVGSTDILEPGSGEIVNTVSIQGSTDMLVDVTPASGEDSSQNDTNDTSPHHSPTHSQ